MLRNLLKIAFRNIWKNKMFSLINIIGLSIGLSAAFVIGAMIYYDLTFDKFHPNGNRIYRVVTDRNMPQGENHSRGVPVPLVDVLKEEIPGIEKSSAFFSSYLNSVDNKSTKNTFKNPEDIIFTDHDYFELFKYKWLAGTPKGVLSNPGEVVLTNKRASKYFPDKSPEEILGLSLVYNDSILVTVTGIIADFEKRSDFTFQEFLSRKTAEYTDMKDQVYNDWWDGLNSGTQVFIQANDGGSIQEISERLDVIAKEHENEELVAMGHTMTFGLQPLNDLHFNQDYGVFNTTDNHASLDILIGLSFIALFLMLLGCINFINLNTAQATKRAKEIGIRKTLGSSKKQLIYQFLGETLLLTLGAAIVSLFLSLGLFRLFSDFMPSEIGMGLFKSPLLILGALLTVMVITLLSGFYPAIVLSQFKPVSVLKNQILPRSDKSSLRKYLTIFQFAIAQVFIIATLLVSKQINYMMNSDMGIKTESIAYISTPDLTSEEKKQLFAKTIKAIPEIGQVSMAGTSPASFWSIARTVKYFAKDSEINTQFQLLSGDNNYLDLYGIQLLAGREPLNDSISEYVINETGMKELGFKNPQEVIGQMLQATDKNIPIVGVIEDFNQRSLKSKIEPLAFIGGLRHSTVHFSFQASDTENWPKAVEKIEKSWKSIYPDEEFHLSFMDDTVKQFYEQERKTSKLLSWATGLAIAISCLGLLGLVIYTTERRTKEIGIRKVLGASLAQLNLLLCKEFLILVGIAFVIAAPIAWYGMNNWLQDFAYKTDLSWWVFVLSGVAMLLISLVIISIRTITAANRNPVKSLRTE